MLTHAVCEGCHKYDEKEKKYVAVGGVSESCPLQSCIRAATELQHAVGGVSESCPLQQRALEEAPAAAEAHAERSAKRRKSEKQVRHVEGAAGRATGARANEPSRHSAGAAGGAQVGEKER
jgi:hypothetical protein